MNINPVQGFKNLTPNQKKAAVAGAIGTAAVAATTILAYTKKGQGTKGINAIKTGYINLYQDIVNGKTFKKVFGKEKDSLISKAKAGVSTLIDKAGNLFKKSEKVAEGAKEAAEKIVG